MPTQKHIVMLPYMAHGHLIPMFHLAKLIEQRYPDHTITIVNTPLNIQRLQSSLPPNSNIHLIDLPFSSSNHGLPPNSENTRSLPAHQKPLLLFTTESFEPHFNLLITNMIKDDHCPVCIIADLFYGWTVNTAKIHNIFHATYMPTGAIGSAFLFSMMKHLPHTKTEAMEFNLPGFPSSFRLHRTQLPGPLRSDDGSDEVSIFFRKKIELSSLSDAFLCNTVKEVETLGLQALRWNAGDVPVYPVGPLVPLEGLITGKRLGEEFESCVQWLGSRSPCSVIYILFGSENNISASQMMALAEGLETSGKPFIWVIRPPHGFPMDGEFSEEWLPDGLEERLRVSGQGLLVKTWAPHLEILGHKSTGVFINHCGNNSLLESLSRGVPIISWPLVYDQFCVSKMMVEELGVCVELASGVEDEVESVEVERVIGLVLDGEKGKEMKKKALKCMEMMREAMKDNGEVKGSSLIALDDFIKCVSVKCSTD
ncbi:crocetin glucosyltransferase 3-like [Dioscorea cayenensis subsp. rotundata]|uniref:Crocetin glucosyltransferase 3-like n=1 Tax=Dioscorea cayennensis subsp. rotundata TaxID=55577 RepID=A0AB40C2M7_DIOCR|nr:crocetin glucosyltransferase 3-like [Dioscorea cayenensis subsp. rotundata]